MFIKNYWQFLKKLIKLSRRVYGQTQRLLVQSAWLIENKLEPFLFWLAKVVNLFLYQSDYRPGTVLICRYRYVVHGSSGWIESCEKQYLTDSLQAERGIKAEEWFWAESPTSSPIFIWSLLAFIIQVLRLRPDLLILSSWSPQDEGILGQPGYWLIGALKASLSTKVVALWWDTCYSSFSRRNIPSMSAVDRHLIMENPLLDIDTDHMSPSERLKLLPLWSPVSPSVFKPREKDIDFCFIGQTSSYRDYRNKYIDAIQSLDLNGVISTQSREDEWMSNEEYAELLGRSKIGINFSFSADRHQLKGRVYEVMSSGALLLESRNPQTGALFNEGEDYIAFDSEQDLIIKLKYYLRHEDERQSIADSGFNKVAELYSHKRFWSKIFDALD